MVSTLSQHHDMRSTLGSFAEPFDPQRVDPTHQLTRTAESNRSRRFAFVALSASNHADSPSLPEPHAVPAAASLAVFTGTVSPCPLRASADAATRVDAGRVDAQKAASQRGSGMCQRLPKAGGPAPRRNPLPGQRLWHGQPIDLAVNGRPWQVFRPFPVTPGGHCIDISNIISNAYEQNNRQIGLRRLCHFLPIYCGRLDVTS